MVDTVVIYVHKLHKYEGMQKLLTDSQSGRNVTALDYEVGDEDLRQRKFIEYREEEKVKLLYTNKRYIPSSHYYLSYRLDYQNDRAVFNFSVPKYLYGTNINQLVHRMGKIPAHTELGIREVGYNSLVFLKGAVRIFIDREFELIGGWDYFEKEDLEINRIDLCFNQIFDTRKEALQYLDLQKRVLRKYHRSDTFYQTDFRTSVFYATKFYAAKIYHKGTEYMGRDGEAKHHLKINRRAKKKVFQIQTENGKQGLKDFADRILRYEISFKKAGMSYYYMNHIFRKGLPIWEKRKRVAQFVNNRNKRYKEHLEIYNSNAKKYMEKWGGHPNRLINGITDGQKKDAEYYNLIVGRRVAFKMNVTPDIKQFERKDLPFHIEKGRPDFKQEAIFDQRILECLVDRFVDFFEKFQINEFYSSDQLDQKVERYNFLVDGKKIQKNSLRRYLALLQVYTFDEMVQNGIISRSNAYYVKKSFARVGIDVANAIMDVGVSASRDFERYLEETELGVVNTPMLKTIF